MRQMSDAIDRAEKPDRTKVAQGAQRLLWWIEKSGGFFSRKTGREAGSPVVEAHFGDWLDRSTPAGSGSELLWHTMYEMDIGDWALDTDLSQVLSKIQEIGTSEGIDDSVIQDAVTYTKKNFETFHELVMTGEAYAWTPEGYVGEAPGSPGFVAPEDLYG